MPKLSEKSLEKRYLCNECGKTLRTLQGLSGHVQFKHSKGQKTFEIDAEEIKSKMNRLKLFDRAWELSQSAVNARHHILQKWLEAQSLCEHLHIRLNNQDFKNYMVTSLAHLYANEQLKEQLKEQLISEIKGLLEEYRLMGDIENNST